MKCRKHNDDVETRVLSPLWDESGGRPAYRPGGIRHRGGASLTRALIRNVGTCSLDEKGETQAGGPCKSESTDARHRGGVARSSEESFVMRLERRGNIVQLYWRANLRREEPIG